MRPIEARRALKHLWQASRGIVFVLAGAGAAAVPNLSAKEQLPAAPINLAAPDLTRTARTVLLTWDAPDDRSAVASYRIFRDGQLVGETTKLSFLVRHLAPDARHEFTVRSVAADGTSSPLSAPVVIQTRSAGEVLDVRAYGARGDGIEIDTPAIQRAIAACPTGGTVRVTAGIYRVGPLQLKSDMTFELTAGATLQFLGRGEGDYPEITEILPGPEGEVSLPLGALITARRARNLSIVGEGRICGNGQTWWDHHRNYRPRALLLVQCENLLVQGLTIEDSPFWTVHALYVDRAVFADVKLLRVAAHESHNVDGIDLDSSRDVLVAGCLIATQDDSIAIKSGLVDAMQPHRQRASERITIRDCVVDATAAPHARPLGFAIGSEDCGGVRHVRVRDCEFRDAASAAYIKSGRARPGAVIEDVRIENCTFINTATIRQARNRSPLSIDLFYGDSSDPAAAQPVSAATPIVRDIHFKNIVVDERVRRGVNLVGLPERPIESVTFTNVTVAAPTGLHAQNLDGVTFENVRIVPDAGPAATWVNVTRRTERDDETGTR